MKEHCKRQNYPLTQRYRVGHHMEPPHMPFSSVPSILLLDNQLEKWVIFQLLEDHSLFLFLFLCLSNPWIQLSGHR